ncbi:MAG: hypothetical protein LQ350_008228 [Teloschistes chrysophthalmus]|nr:MAG: hypothetical protein LQ350_008228 [Niorma chrysophthalma]
MLKFATFTSEVELPFYTSLASLKIDHDKLDDSWRLSVAPGLYRAEGMIKNVNTIEDYRNLDKSAILTQAGRTVWDAINDGTIYSCPSLLSSFVMILFADLKKYKFTYLFGFPALHSESAWTLKYRDTSFSGGDGANTGIAEHTTSLTSAESVALVESVQTWRYSVDARQYGFFLAKRVYQYNTTQGNINLEDERPQSRSTTPEASRSGLDYYWVIGSLAKYEAGFFEGVDLANQFVCFADPSTYREYPGWMLRNLLVLISKRWCLEKVQVLCYRDIQSRREEARSLVLQLKLDSDTANSQTIGGQGNDSIISEQMPRVSGWERSSSGKISSKIANLGEYMNPERLADQAVDLNLKLIKWRISPGLDLDVVKTTKCLLLGAGTLGSYVSRNLMGWGVLRQPLFNFQDCVNGGARKALRAAEALKEIYPGVQSEGHVISVPMAGHPILDEAGIRNDYEVLAQLIQEHDAIFLLMDTRESRWLPTVMGKAMGKIVMNAALGFDSYLVMRHGLLARDEVQPQQSLGCYFCSDVVAPADSVADRTLDQQCTVTRPGIAAIASALLVEMFVSVLQHPERAFAPAPASPNEDRGEHPLGVVPHQVRGFLSNFQNLVIKGNSYDCCSACSPQIIDAYEADGWQFVKRALNEKDYVEELSGLAEVHRTAEKALAEIEFSDDDDGTHDDEEPEII